jgi:hypothetical protein
MNTYVQKITLPKNGTSGPQLFELVDGERESQSAGDTSTVGNRKDIVTNHAAIPGNKITQQLELSGDSSAVALPAPTAESVLRRRETRRSRRLCERVNGLEVLREYLQLPVRDLAKARCLFINHDRSHDNSK